MRDRIRRGCDKSPDAGQVAGVVKKFASKCTAACKQMKKRAGEATPADVHAVVYVSLSGSKRRAGFGLFKSFVSVERDENMKARNDKQSGASCWLCTWSPSACLCWCRKDPWTFQL